MNQPSRNLKEVIKAFLGFISSQKTIFIFSVVSAIFGCMYCLDIGDEAFFRNLWLSLLFSTLCLFSGSYLTDKLPSYKKYLIQSILGVATATMMMMIFHFTDEESYKWMYYLGFCFAITCWTIFIFQPKKNNQSYYANILKYFLFCGLVSLVGFLGGILLVYAFSNLLHEINKIDKIIGCIAIIFFEVFYINFFVFHLFEKRTEPSGKAFKTIFMYIVLPVYFLLIVLLYAYLIKALCMMKLPQGQINWFVSFASAIFLVLYFILEEYKEAKALKLFYRFGALILVPLMMVQFPAFFIRVKAYGYTGWRYSSLLFNIFSLCFVVFTFIKKGRYVKFSLPVLGIIILVSSVTPLNIINVAFNSQYNILCSVLDKYGMLNADRTALTDYDATKIAEDMSYEDKNFLFESWAYIRWTSEHKKPVWMDKNLGYSEQFGISVSGYSIQYINLLFECSEINIEGYKSLSRISLEKSTDDEEIPPVIQEIGYNLRNDILECLDKDSTELFEKVIDDRNKVILTKIYARYNRSADVIEYYDISGYLLSK